MGKKEKNWGEKREGGRPSNTGRNPPSLGKRGGFAGGRVPFFCAGRRGKRGKTWGGKEERKKSLAKITPTIITFCLKVPSSTQGREKEGKKGAWGEGEKKGEGNNRGVFFANIFRQAVEGKEN